MMIPTAPITIDLESDGADLTDEQVRARSNQDLSECSPCPNCRYWSRTELQRWGMCFMCDPTRKRGFARGYPPKSVRLWVRFKWWLWCKLNK